MTTIEKECIVCGNVFLGRADKMYCSGKCRVRSHRQAEMPGVEDEEEEMEEPDLLWLEPTPKRIPRVVEEDEEVDLREMIRTQWAEYNAQEAAARLAQQQRAQATRASEVHAVYVKAIEALLHWEGQKMSKTELCELLVLLIDALEDYKLHPFLGQPDNVARQRLNDLRDAIGVVQETDHEAQASWGFGYNALYELKNKWRKQLRERLLE